MIKPYYQKGDITIYQGDCLETLKAMDSESVDMCLCSPPYWGLRDYGHNGQLGLEPTYQEYIDKLIAIFDEVRRVLKDTGTCWVNLGDTYSNNSSVQEKGRQGFGNDKIGNRNNKQLQEKTLIGIPERFAIAMTDERYKCGCGWAGNKLQTKFAGDYYCPACGDLTEKHNGWIRRNTIIWHKPNCMPSSADDRFTVDFEYLYFFTKKPQYYFEQQFDKHLTPLSMQKPREPAVDVEAYKKTGVACTAGSSGFGKQGRNKRCVWQLSTQSYPEAHFATYPEKLCEIPIKAGCPKGGVVCDPFAGSFTTLKVARELGRKGIGIELNEDYIKMGIKRMKLDQALFQFNA